VSPCLLREEKPMRDLNTVERWILMLMTLALANKQTDLKRLGRMLWAAESVQRTK
jgi:hypothetical protein